jgi:hypothetical protein
MKCAYVQLAFKESILVLYPGVTEKFFFFLKKKGLIKATHTENYPGQLWDLL